MSKRDIYRAAKKAGVEVVSYEAHSPGPAMLFEGGGEWMYEVWTKAPDGSTEYHSDVKEFVLKRIQKHGDDYRQRQAQA